MRRRRGGDAATALVTAIAAVMVGALVTSAPPAAASPDGPPVPTTRGGELVDVVVHLDLAEAGGTGLSPVAEQTRRFVPLGRVPAEVALDRAQSTVIDELRGAGAEELHRFERLPYLTLRVPRSELGAIAAHPAVRGVDEDEVVETLLARSLPLIGAVASGTEDAVTV